MIDPNATKRWLCLVPSRRWFFRINSSGRYAPNHKLSRSSDTPFLDWDSFVELRVLRPKLIDFTDACRRPDNPLGKLGRADAADIAFAAQRAHTITAEQQRLINEALTAR